MGRDGRVAGWLLAGDLLPSIMANYPVLWHPGDSAVQAAAASSCCDIQTPLLNELPLAVRVNLRWRG